jgi:hypothetical protein
MYRPTVRYPDIYKKYVDKLFHATTLDRNQIIRAALFGAAYSQEFLKQMYIYKKKDVTLPSPLWQLDQMELWLEQNPNIREEKDVNAIHPGSKETENDIKSDEQGGRQQEHQFRRIESRARRDGEIPTRIKTEGGGIKIRIG